MINNQVPTHIRDTSISDVSNLIPGQPKADVSLLPVSEHQMDDEHSKFKPQSSVSNQSEQENNFEFGGSKPQTRVVHPILTQFKQLQENNKDKDKNKIDSKGKIETEKIISVEEEAANSLGTMDQKDLRQRYHKWLKPEALIGEMDKVSGYGFSKNTRLLKLDTRGLSYYSKVPPHWKECTCNGTTLIQQKTYTKGKDGKEEVKEIIDEKKCPVFKPKCTIPLYAILSVRELNEDERKKHSKFLKDPEVKAFIIEFNANEIKKNGFPDNPGESIDYDNCEDWDPQKEFEDKMSKNKKESWILIQTYKPVTNEDGKIQKDEKGNPIKEPQLPGVESWLTNLSLLIMGTTQKFEPNKQVQNHIAKIIAVKEREEKQKMSYSDKMKLGVGHAFQKKRNQLRIEDNFSEQSSPKEEKKEDEIENDMEMLNDFKISQIVMNVGRQNVGQQKGNKQKHRDNRASAFQSGFEEFTASIRPQGANRQSSKFQITKQLNAAAVNEMNELLEKSQEISQALNSREREAWDVKFQNFWTEIINCGENLSQCKHLSEQFISHLGNFRKTAEEVVIKIVDNLQNPFASEEDCCPPLKKTDRQMNEIKPLIEEYDLQEDKSRMFFMHSKHTKNILIKLTYQGEQTEEVQNVDKIETFMRQSILKQHKGSVLLDQASLVDSVQTKEKAVDKQLSSIKRRSCYKLFSREHLSYDVCFDAMQLIPQNTEDNKIIMRIPLTALVSYKGFRAIAYAHVEFLNPQAAPRVGFWSEDEYYSYDDQCTQILSQLGLVLNLKEDIYQNQQNQQIPISKFIQVRELSNSDQADNDDIKRISQNERLKKWFDDQMKDLLYENGDQICYLLKTTEIFPFEMISGQEKVQHDKVLRPELVTMFESSLKTDTKKNHKIDVIKRSEQKDAKDVEKNKKIRGKKDKEQDNEDETLQLQEATNFLNKTMIPMLVKLLDSLVVIPTDSTSLEQIFHMQGVNMRYLGRVAQETELLHVKEICMIEMIARTLKRMLFSQLAARKIELRNQSIKNKEQIDHNDKCLKEQRDMSISGLNQKGLKQNKAKMQKEIKRLNGEKTNLDRQKQNIDEEQSLMQNEEERITLDFLNMVFGAPEQNREERPGVKINDEEFDYFWYHCIFPAVEQYYDIKCFDEKQKYKPIYTREMVKLQALYFTFVEHAGIKVTLNMRSKQESEGKEKNLAEKVHQEEGRIRRNTERQIKFKEEPFQALLGKSRTPFGNTDTEQEREYKVKFKAKSQTYKLRQLCYTKLAENFEEYKENGRLEAAMDSVFMMNHLQTNIHGNKYLSTTAQNYCQIMLEKGQWKHAIHMAEKALERIHPSHANSIPFICILIQAYYQEGHMDYAQTQFTRSLQVLETHWGPYHPLHIHIYSIMAQLLIQSNKFEEAKYLYQASIVCCYRILGPNHLQTAQVQMDYGHLFKKSGQKSEAIQHFEEAFSIYKLYFGERALQTAQAAAQLASLMEDERRIDEAREYAECASEVFVHVYSSVHYKSIFAIWQQVTILYALNDESTIKHCSALFQNLNMRDYLKEEQKKRQHLNLDSEAIYRGYTEQEIEKFEQLNLAASETSEAIEIQLLKIKKLLVATAIMDITRKQDTQDKKLLKAFCDKQLFIQRLKQQKQSSKGNQENIPSLIEYHVHKLDPQATATVKNLDQSFTSQNMDQLMEWYETHRHIFTDEQIQRALMLSKKEKNESNQADSDFIPYYENRIKNITKNLIEENDQKTKDMGDQKNKFTGIQVNIERENESFDDDEGQKDRLNALSQTLEKNRDKLLGADFIEDQKNQEKQREEKSKKDKLEDEKQFFKMVIQTFDLINFYNLLIFKNEKKKTK